AAQVLDLLRLGLGLEPDLAVEDAVPHGHQVRRAVGTHRAHGGAALLDEELGDLLVRHGDRGSLVDAHGWLPSDRFRARVRPAALMAPPCWRVRRPPSRGAPAAWEARPPRRAGRARPHGRGPGTRWTAWTRRTSWTSTRASTSRRCSTRSPGRSPTTSCSS